MSQQLDLSLQLLLDSIQQYSHAKNVLWLADEHTDEQTLSIVSQQKNITIISNRFDIIEQAQRHGYKAYFNDFVLTATQTAYYDYVFFRLPKEKALYQHLFRIAFNALSAHGRLFFSAAKKEGLKSALQFAENIFSEKTNRVAKKKSAYCYAIQQQSAETVQLDSAGYTSVQHLTNSDSISIVSKPGQYGWNKIDTGSQLLADLYQTIVDRFDKKPQHFLDLGCGYGYLTLRSKAFKLVSRTATDNNAAAIASCLTNCQNNQLNCQVIASNAGAQLQQKYDWIVCNPPFHRGFFTQPQLLDLFLTQTQRLLSSTGKASFVTNEFIPLQRQAHTLFSNIELIHSEQGFNIHLLHR